MKFIYSNGGFAREFARCIRDANPTEDIFYVDDAPSDNAISYDEARQRGADEAGAFVIGFSNGSLRRRKTEQVLSDGFDLFSVQARTSLVGDNVTIGEGAILSDFTMVTADAQIGMSFQCNIYSYIAHDCTVGDFVTLAPRVSVNGRVEIGDEVYIGTGATILPGSADRPLKIGTGAVIGAQALVTQDVPAHTTVIGMPAKPLRRRT